MVTVFLTAFNVLNITTLINGYKGNSRLEHVLL